MYLTSLAITPGFDAVASADKIQTVCVLFRFAGDGDSHADRSATYYALLMYFAPVRRIQAGQPALDGMHTAPLGLLRAMV
jgi:hypothetical protein